MGPAIAEGDALTLCTQLFSDLLPHWYCIPLPDPTESLIARHAASLFEANKALLGQFSGGRRSPEFDTLILPQAEQAIEAMGYAMAYSAALRSGLPKPILDVYECAVVRRDQAWYSEKGGLTRHDQRVREDRAIASAVPHLARCLDDLNIEAYVSAPILSDASGKKSYDGLPKFKEDIMPTSHKTGVRL